MKLESECDNCKGSGRIKTYSTSKSYMPNCYVCSGRGKLPTEEGRKLLDFLRFYLRQDFIPKE